MHSIILYLLYLCHGVRIFLEKSVFAYSFYSRYRTYLPYCELYHPSTCKKFAIDSRNWKPTLHRMRLKTVSMNNYGVGEDGMSTIARILSKGH